MKNDVVDNNILFQLALTYEEQEKYKNAIKLYNHILDNNPDNLTVLYNLGIIHKRLENYEQAIEYFNHYIEINPHDAYACFNLGMIYKELEMIDESINLFNRGLKLDPQDGEALYELGDIYQNKEDYEKALHVFNKATKLNSKDFRIWSNLGSIYFEIEQYQESVQCYEKAVVLNLDCKEVWMELGVSYEHINELDKAIEAFKEALHLDPEYILARSNLGISYSIKGEYDMSIKELKNVLKEDPTNSDAWYQLGVDYFQKEVYDIAIEYLNQALKHDSEDIQTLDLLGEIYQLTKKYKSAADCFKQVLEIAPLNDQARENLKQIEVLEKNNISNGTLIQVLRGGDWIVEGNQSVFNYKVKIQNISQSVVTDIQVILTSIPEGLKVQVDRKRIKFLKPNSFISPSFKLIATDSCVGDSVEGIVTFIDNRGKSQTIPIRTFEIKYVCNLLTPKEITSEEFDRKSALMKKKELVIESDIDFSKIIPKVKTLVQECNFALLEQLHTSQKNTYKKILGFAQGLYDKQDVALSIAVRKMDQGSTLIVEALSERDEKLTDLLKDVNIKLDDIKSDTELIKEYTSQIEEIFERTEDIESYLKSHIGSDWEKIKHIWDEYKKGKITRKQMIMKCIKILGKKFIKKIIPLVL